MRLQGGQKQTTIQNGFTIVELLIVIVVIGILATITIVAFNGVQGRASDAAVQSDLHALKTKLDMYYVDNGLYPNSPQLPSLGFRASMSSYAVSPVAVHNLIYCKKVGDNSLFAVIALSKSGNRFIVTNDTSVQSFASAWGTDQTALCNTALSTPSTTNARGYAFDDTTTGPWRAWTGS